MPGFAYYQHDPTGSNRLRHYINLAGEDRQTKAGQFNLPTSGSISITGIGFEPEALVLFGAGTTDSTTDGARIHIGVAAGGSQWGLSIHGTYISPHEKICVHRNDRILAGIEASGDEYSAELASFDSDGFTIDVITGHTNTTTVFYIAMAGEAGYACGTTLAPSGTGTQSISGLGFEPGAVMFSTVQIEALGYFSGFHRLCIGAGDELTSTNAWSGTESNDPYHDSIATTDKALSMFRETNAGSPYDPVLLAEAELSGTDGDGFDLNWTAADGTQRYYSWFAIGGQAEVGWWNYPDALPGPEVATLPTKKVITQYAPRGLITYANDLGTTTRDYPATDGDAMGFAVCDYEFGQKLSGYMTVGAGVIGGNQYSSTYFAGYGLGSHQRRNGGIFATAPDTGHDEGIVVAWLVRKPQIIRYRSSI